MPAITPGLRGTSRKRAIQAHRLLCYVDSLNKFMQHKVTLEYVLERADKCLECGLKPKL